MKIADLDFDNQDSKRSAPKDRIPIIKEVFDIVLGREPSSRELSFYKYGVQEKDEIINKLLNDKEHGKIVKKAKRVPKVEEKARQAEHRVAQLTQQIKDMEEESKQTRDLLDEKNREIAILRREKSDPYNFTHSDALKYIKGLSENSRVNVNTQAQEGSTDSHFSSISASENQKKRSFLDRVYNLIKG